MVRVANFTGLPIGAVMLVGRPVILSRPRSRSWVPPCGAAGGAAAVVSWAIAAGLTAGAAAVAGAAGPVTGGGGLGMTGLGWAGAAAGADGARSSLAVP